jgi:hypothetical protein
VHLTITPVLSCDQSMVGLETSVVLLHVDTGENEKIFDFN